MKLFLHLAWRNLWRNKRRTLICVSSVCFAVLLALVMRSMQNGTYDFMIESSVGLYTGYLQVHGVGYWDKRSIDQSIEILPGMLDSLSSSPGVTQAAPRLESIVLLSKGSATKIAQMSGVDPAREDAMTGLSKRLREGRFIRTEDHAMLLGGGLAERLNVHVGDSIVVYGQGYHGVTAAANVPVIGILRFPIPELDDTFCYAPLGYAQTLFDAPDRVTSVALMISSQDKMLEIQRRLSRTVGKGVEVMNWQEMMPELVQSIQADSSGGIIMLLILYIVIGFGIFGTIMMMTNERAREYGILIAVGMKRWRLVAVSVAETCFVSLLGAGIGMLVGIPFLWYLHLHPIALTGEAAAAMLAYGLEPILPFSIAPGIFIGQTLVVFVLAVVCALYPLVFIRGLRPVSALRS